MGRAHGGGPVGQGKDPVQHADGQRLAAGRTDAPVTGGLLGLKHHRAFAMAVEVIFSFLGIKFEGAFKACRLALAAQGAADARKGHISGKDIGLSPQFLAGMGVGIGNQGKTVEGAAHPVHLRVGGEACFEGENFPAQITETVLDPVETGL